MEVKEFIEAIESGKAQVLTLENIKGLIGKKVYTLYFGDRANYNEVRTFVFGEIISEWDYAGRTEIDGYPSQQAWWEVYMTEEKKKRAKENVWVLDENGKNTYIKCEANNPFYKEPTFICSDSDREVYFIVAED